MSEPFANAYADPVRAGAYADLGLAGTYRLAFRDIPALLARHVAGTLALDFGCGAGRSSRFLQALGFMVTGVDIAPAMLAEARARDPQGRYLLVPDGDLSPLGAARFDLVFCAYPFDNIPGLDHRRRLFRQFAERLTPGGRVVNLVSAPALYHHDWLSFTAREFPGNATAASGDRVQVTIRDGTDQRPVDDLYWTAADYQLLYDAAGLHLIETHRPLGRSDDPEPWVTELTVSPWVIDVVGSAA